jgi:hypothetical protein
VLHGTTSYNYESLDCTENYDESQFELLNGFKYISSPGEQLFVYYYGLLMHTVISNKICPGILQAYEPFLDPWSINSGSAPIDYIRFGETWWSFGYGMFISLHCLHLVAMTMKTTSALWVHSIAIHRTEILV